jgi:hypothetical protein
MQKDFMNHPKQEEWLPYLDGEAAPETARRLAEHLKHCPECAAEIAGWQRSIQKLQQLDWPHPLRTGASWIWPTLKWGIAAAIVVGVGFTLGRASAPDAGKIKAETIAQVRAELRQEMQSDLLAALAADPQSAKDSFQRQLAQQMQHVSARERDEDRRAMAGILNQLQQKETTDYLSLRKDLENLASTADDRLQQTRRQLNQIAANSGFMNENP